MLRALEFSVPREQALAFSRARLRITWDRRADASIDAPIGLFFGAGILYNRDNREYLVKSLPMVVRYDPDRVHLSCYLPMPFFRSARVELTGDGVSGVEWRIRWAAFKDPPNHVGYLHATYRDHPSPEPGQDLVLLDTRQTEGGGAWSGSFIGTSFIFSHDAVLNTLEGDPRFFFDDSRTPQAYGTGTEEWGGGGDYWGGINMTLPFAGHPAGAKSAKDAVSAGRQCGIRLPLSARRPDALRTRRRHPPGTRRHQRIHRALRDCRPIGTDCPRRPWFKPTNCVSATPPASAHTATNRPRLRRRTKSPRATSGGRTPSRAKKSTPPKPIADAPRRPRPNSP